MSFSISWPQAHPFDRPTGTIKKHPEDFRVIERLPEQASGAGEHLWLEIEKIGQNTAWVARQLAKWAGVSQRDVSYAGLKDRHAVTEQTFSLHLPGKTEPDLATLAIEGCKVLSAKRHNRKLKTGQLIGNQFSLRIRDLSMETDALKAQWQLICEQGVPNYFGPQRFGREGNNVNQGIDWLLGKGKVPRHLQSIYLSAVRSYLFNELLAQRVLEGTWNTLIAHDFAQFTEGKTGFYVEQPAVEDHERCQQGRLSPAASLVGVSKDEFGALEQRERQVLAPYQEAIKALEQKKVARHFRKLRLFPEQASFQIDEADPVISFFLPAGAFATSVLTELVDFNVTALGEMNE